MVEDLAILVKQAKKDDLALMDVLDRLNPLIRSYTKKLFFLDKDDAKQEITLAIIEAVHFIENCSSEGCCINFLKNAVYFRYCSLCKHNIRKNSNEITISKDGFADEEYIENYEKIELDYDMQKKIKKLELNKIQMDTVKLVYEGLSDKEIALQLGISRQYINRIKKKVFARILSDMRSN